MLKFIIVASAVHSVSNSVWFTHSEQILLSRDVLLSIDHAMADSN